jgi:hypothetical protein
MRSGTTSFQIVPRKMALTASDAPATARAAIASQSGPATPKTTIAAPQPAAAIATARPWRMTWRVQPLASESASAPAAGAA